MHFFCWYKIYGKDLLIFNRKRFNQQTLIKYVDKSKVAKDDKVASEILNAVNVATANETTYDGIVSANADYTITFGPNGIDVNYKGVALVLDASGNDATANSLLSELSDVVSDLTVIPEAKAHKAEATDTYTIVFDSDAVATGDWK